MWISVLGLSLLMAVHPLRLGVTLLMISRPRPVQNLIAYWVGSVGVGLPALLVPLMVLHGTPAFRSFAIGSTIPGTNCSAHYIQIGLGVLSLSAAAFMAVRFAKLQRVHLPTAGGNASPLVLEPSTPNAVSRLLGLGQATPAEDRSTIRRLRTRVHKGWGTGALWVALVTGVVMAPSPDVVLTVLAIVVPSGAPIGSQVGAAIAFVVGMFADAEIILVSYLITPAKTEAVLRMLQNWASAQRRKLLVATPAAIGVLLVATGMGVA
ncbi:GAP family protein [Mycobacterium colombiense]|uniref:GAP family protein n=1 Tax=Mycobacterium colombiense TaxID=339268 RepID=UPI00197B885E|nr:GAP family protein [Mycobacterium colombiense]